MSGIPGSGKSTLAKEMSRITKAVLINTDVLKSSVMTSFENEIDFKFAGKVSYDAAFALADSNLAIGNSVIIDSPCGYEIIWERGIYLSRMHSASYKFVECYLKDLHELNRRRTDREILPSQACNVPINALEYQESIKYLKRPAGYEYLLIDTSPSVEEYIEKTINYLITPNA